MASSCGHLNIVTYLINHGANVKHRDIRGNTALDDARREGRKHVVAYLEGLEKSSENRSVS